MTTPLDPRTFCGDAYPWPLISDLQDGHDVTACYLVLETRRGETKTNKPYLRLVLGDRTGSIEAVIWDDADRLEAVCAAESVIGVQARVQSYNERLQLKVSSARPLVVGTEDLDRFLPASPRPHDVMERELDAFVASIRDRGLVKLLRRCVGRGTELGKAYRSHPAAKRNHHAYVGGLLEHSLSVAGSCARLAEHYAGQGRPLDTELLVTAALLHDIGKVRELSGFPSNVYTTEGRLLGHIVMGMQMVRDEARAVPELSDERLLLLLHLIASHQGKPEWDSPRVPQMLEAIVLHYADDLDAKVNQAGGLLDTVEPGEWTGYDRSLERSMFRPASRGSRGEGRSGSAADSTIDMFGS